MVRPRSTDFLQNHKFALVEIPAGKEREAFFDRTGNFSSGSALIGCKSISIPEITVEPLELVEGTEMFTHHINTGRASTGDVVITLGVDPNGSVGLYSWIHRAIYGLGSTRKDFDVHHFRNTTIDPTTLGIRIYRLEGCIPVAYKLASDLDSEDDAISLEEITLHPHRIKLETNTADLSAVNDESAINDAALFEF